MRLIMRQSVIGVPSPSRTAASHYLQIHLGRAHGQKQSRFTDANRWPRTRPRWMYFSRYTAKYKQVSRVACRALCTRVWMQLSVCAAQLKFGFSCGLRPSNKDGILSLQLGRNPRSVHTYPFVHVCMCTTAPSV